MTGESEFPQTVMFTHMHPVLAVRDLAEEIAYYEGQLGFAVTWKWGDPTVRAGVARDGFEIQLVADGRFAPSHPSYVYVQLQGVDEYYRKCLESGAKIQMPIDDRPFGVRDFRVTDRSGNMLGFSEPLR